MKPQIDVNENVLSNLSERLMSAPSEKGMSLWQLMLSLQPALETARKNGKTVEQMHADLVASGIEANWGTFKKYASDLLSDSTPAKRTSQESKSVAKKAASAHSKLTNTPLSDSQTQGLRNMRFGKRAQALNTTDSNQYDQRSLYEI